MIDHSTSNHGADQSSSAEYWSNRSETQDMMNFLDPTPALADNNDLYWFWDTMWDGAAQG